jgi:nitroalkane oxidase
VLQSFESGHFRVELLNRIVTLHRLADAKTTIEAARALSWHACRSFDTAAPGALELAIHAKVFGSEAAVRVITNLMQVVGVDSYGHELPLAGLLQDAMALPLFAGGNIGVRRRQLHALMLDPVYDDLATLDGICLAETVP